MLQATMITVGDSGRASGSRSEYVLGRLPDVADAVAEKIRAMLLEDGCGRVFTVEDVALCEPERPAPISR